MMKARISSLIFGLLFATMLTLVILPVLYYLFCRVLRLIKE